MNLRLLLRVAFLLSAFTLMQACGSDTETTPPDPGSDTDRVSVGFYAATADFQRPVTRTGTAQESVVSDNVWALVFTGTDANATYVEAAKLIKAASGNKYFLLKKSAVACRVLIIANLDNITDTGGTSYTVSEATFNTLLGGGTPKTLTQASDMLLTVPLAVPQTSVPYTPSLLLPMSYLHDLPGGISATTSFGTSGTPLSLERSVAKVFVVNNSASATLKGATVIKAPVRGQIYRSGTTPRNNSGALTNYLAASGDRVTGIAEAAAAGLSSQNTSANPIYVYESRTNEETSVIIKATYLGTDYYYKLQFKDAATQQVVPILRNHQYDFIIDAIGVPGYTDLDDAIAAPYSNITFSLLVTNLSSYENIYNGSFYLSVSNSEFLAYTNVLSGLNVCTVATDREEALKKNSLTASAGVTLTSPATGKLTLGSGGAVATTDIIVTLTTTGTITIELEDYTKTIDVVRQGAAQAASAGSLALGTDYDSGQVDDGSISWLRLSFDNDYDNGHAYLAGFGLPIYICYDQNTTGVQRTGYIYLWKNDGRRSKVMIVQNP